MNAERYPPNIGLNDCVILFDGVCKLCNAWAQFIIKYDRKKRFKLCSVQSLEGQSILRHFNMPTEYFDTMLYVQGAHCFEKSDAFLNVMNRLGFPWGMLCVLRVIPPVLRNWLYDRIALNRYSLFGKYDNCMLPSKENENRFLKSKV